VEQLAEYRDDKKINMRYDYGELRLSRLNKCTGYAANSEDICSLINRMEKCSPQIYPDGAATYISHWY